MKQRIRKSALLIMLLGSAPAIGFAADEGNCSTCSNTSPIITKYIQFSEEMLKVLQSIAQEKSPANGGGTAKGDAKATLDRIVNNLNQKSQTAVTFGVLVGTIGTQLIATNTRQEMQMMANAKSLMRDREKLDKLDQKIADAIFDLGQAGVYISNLSSYQQRVNDIIKKYTDQSDSFLTKDGEGSPQVAVVITALRDMNQAYKRFIAGGRTDGFDVFTQKYKDTLGIGFSEESYTKLVAEYECARGFNKCDANYKDFKKNIGSISKDAKKEVQEAIKTVKDSLQRLKCAFAKETNVECDQAGFAQKQNDLLKGLYGLDAGNVNKTGSVAKGFDQIGNALKSEVDDLQKFYAGDKNSKPTTTKSSAPSVATVTPDIISAQKKKDLTAQFTNTVDEILVESSAGRQQHVRSDPSVATKTIPNISTMVYSAIDLIGDGQSQKTITQSLGKACENQCTNAGGTCYY